MIVPARRTSRARRDLRRSPPRPQPAGALELPPVQRAPRAASGVQELRLLPRPHRRRDRGGLSGGCWRCSFPGRAPRRSAWVATSTRRRPQPAPSSRRPIACSASGSRRCASRARRTSCAAPRSSSRRFSRPAWRCCARSRSAPRWRRSASRATASASTRALVASGALALESAVALVHARGRFMQEAVPEGRGAMAAVLGAEAEAVAESCAVAARETGLVVEPANWNSPLQTVIAGDAAAVERACAEAKQRGARKTVSLAVSAPFHCSLMAPAADKLEAELAGVRFAAPRVPVVTNVEAAPNARRGPHPRAAAPPGHGAGALHRERAPDRRARRAARARDRPGPRAQRPRGADRARPRPGEPLVRGGNRSGRDLRPPYGRRRTRKGAPGCRWKTALRRSSWSSSASRARRWCPQASFIDDLGADSLDIVELVMAMEEEFDIEIPDDDAEKIQTIGDAIAYLKEKSRGLVAMARGARRRVVVTGLGCVTPLGTDAGVDLGRAGARRLGRRGPRGRGVRGAALARRRSGEGRGRPRRRRFQGAAPPRPRDPVRAGGGAGGDGGQRPRGRGVRARARRRRDRLGDRRALHPAEQPRRVPVGGAAARLALRDPDGPRQHAGRLRRHQARPARPELRARERLRERRPRARRGVPQHRARRRRRDAGGRRRGDHGALRRRRPSPTCRRSRGATTSPPGRAAPSTWSATAS